MVAIGAGRQSGNDVLEHRGRGWWALCRTFDLAATKWSAAAFALGVTRDHTCTSLQLTAVACRSCCCSASDLTRRRASRCVHTIVERG